jgi:hypothetical protein
MTETLEALLAWLLIGIGVVAFKLGRLINHGLPKEGRAPVVIGSVLLWPLLVVAVMLDWLEGIDDE